MNYTDAFLSVKEAIMKANIRYKDSVFTKLFSDEQRLLELYNALTGSSYDSSAKIVIKILTILWRGFLLERKFIILCENVINCTLTM
jgi:hypothetical protein